ncbi:MAG: prefoldin subunit alpha [Candidatus Bathyarchaeia archaeon]|nr:prefoldin subunit alpha [Candidatus Bathyarchaeota archaeon]
MSKEVEETLRRLLIENRILEASIAVIQSRLKVVNASLAEILLASSTLEGIKGKPKGSKILVPIGAGSFIRAELADSEKIIMGIGAGTSIEKSFEESIQELKNRQAELEKIRASLEQQLIQATSQLEEKRKALSSLIQAQKGA